jgi:hypothetical protein
VANVYDVGLATVQPAAPAAGAELDSDTNHAATSAGPLRLSSETTVLDVEAAPASSKRPVGAVGATVSMVKELVVVTVPVPAAFLGHT